MDLQANMRLIDKEDLFAIGSVTINGIFTIHDVRVVNITLQDGTDRLVTFLPREREGDSWRPVFKVSPELKKEIDTAVGLSLKEAVINEVFDDEVDISITLYNKGSLLGYADLNYAGSFKIENIRIYRAEDEGKIRLVYPYSRLEEQYQPLVDVNGMFANKDITRMVKKAYDEKLRVQELNRREQTR